MITAQKNSYSSLHNKNYNYRTDEDTSKYTSYGYQLIYIIKNILKYDSINLINDKEYIMSNQQRVVDYIISRIVNIGFYYSNKYDEKSTEYEKVLLDKLKVFLDIDESIINKIFILVKNICINYIKTDPTQKAKDSIRKFARLKSHKCYICGRKLDAEKQTDRKNKEIKEKRKNEEYYGDLLEIEHILPRAYGGALNKENITVACEHCNKIKDDKLSYADCYFEGFISNSDSVKSVQSKLTKDIKFSILYKQEFKCNICNTKLYNLDIENIIFYKKEVDEPFHFTNVLMCCENCSSDKKIEGIANGSYL